MDVSQEWKGGTLLADAWVKFAPARLRAEYYDYERGDVHGHPPQKLDFDSASPEQRLQITSKIFPQVLEQLGMLELPVMSAMRDAVFARLEKGALMAVGIPVKPTPSLQPVPIPDTMLKASFIKWNKSAIEGGGFAFRDVKLIRPPKIGGSATTETSPQTQQPNERRSLKDKRDETIRQAFARVLPTLPQSHSKTHVVQMIYAELKLDPLFPAGRGLSYDKVCRALDGVSGF